MRTLTMRLGAPVSVVVELLDDFTAEPPAQGDIKVLLQGYPVNAIAKSAGQYVFTNLPDGSYELEVRSTHYLHCQTQITVGSLDPKHPVVSLLLKPAPNYSFPSGATLLRARVVDVAGQAIPDVGVRGTVLSGNGARARLVPANGNGEERSGTIEYRLMHVLGRIIPGDIYLLRSKEDGCEEYNQVKGYLRDNRSITFYQPFSHSYGPGALLLPCVETRTDQRGEVVVYFRHPSVRRFEGQIELKYGQQVISEKVTLEDGGTIKLCKSITESLS
ncbi:hypothetical protein GTO89_14875 [Heliobacterium gestii]|uniref:Carboxypeptidase regulatory-like domain-containing protein n=1 Tax=Heliomicrobium gestii TaxID=2699 RepID=A0A845LN54_HELGE|nr:hypothetical protein [Heliomicrobium gestii]MBM7868050.1 hypothetical protein [Heliomicrobium gestii]MZP44316.1 hypothetical protein [Heliomicrobium gestii]